MRVYKYIVILSLLVLPLISQAATSTWDGGGTTNAWSECANWNSDTCPTSSDIALFSGSSTKNSTINSTSTANVLGINIITGYTGTLTQATSVTIGTSGFFQNAGTFTGSTSTINMRGSFFLNGGIFTSTS